eukprot:10764646-Alexandrium_andersonii.AAC.1
MGVPISRPAGAPSPSCSPSPIASSDPAATANASSQGAISPAGGGRESRTTCGTEAMADGN